MNEWDVGQMGTPGCGFLPPFIFRSMSDDKNFVLEDIVGMAGIYTWPNWISNNDIHK
jgi:hypothetical protein